jgi:N4-gp56 family major capsid protein
VIAVTDILNATSLLNIMSQAVKTNGEDAALKCDTLIRDELVNNGDTDESDDRTKRYSGGAANWAALAALSDANGKIAATDLLDSVTNLKINRAPQIGGHYVMIAAPQVTRDLMNNTDWLEAHKYSAVQGLFKGEVGAFHGVKVIEDTNPYVEDADAAKGAHVTSGGEIYSSFVMGGDAFGVPALAGDSPKSPSVLITDTADKSDPLNQTTTIGWKAYYTAKVLNSNWFVVLRSRSAYS